MVTQMLARGWFALTLLLFLSAAEAAVPTAITRVPFTITRPGRYVLARSFAVTTLYDGITINADNVTIDLGGWTLELTGEDNFLYTQLSGISSQDHSNVTIRNGTIRGFYRGIQLSGTGIGHVVENVQALGCSYVGIRVYGNSSTIRGNRVVKIGGSLAYVAERIGIECRGDGMQVLDNTVSDVVPTTNDGATKAYGIRVLLGDEVNVSGNRVVNYTKFPFASSATQGILIDNSGWGIVAGNQISGFDFGINFPAGGQNLYRDNTVTRAFTSYFETSGTATRGPGNSP